MTARYAAPLSFLCRYTDHLSMYLHFLCRYTDHLQEYYYYYYYYF